MNEKDSDQVNPFLYFYDPDSGAPGGLVFSIILLLTYLLAGDAAALTLLVTVAVYSVTITLYRIWRIQPENNTKKQEKSSGKK